MCFKICPDCGRQYPETANYCRACGLKLEKKEVNRCSENKGAMCRKLVFHDDDLYCECCGALTTFAAARAGQRPPEIKSVPVF